ncbi:MAG TPA: MmcQ/YjbR family DNA-binding protein [Puia sp.]|nr:MmcQ/YjbR family DNA-binding protein [Puia sp.]
MFLDELRNICHALPGTTEDIKWESDLCFNIGGKMYCVASLEIPTNISLKVKDEEFDEISNRPGFQPAPYLARYHWVLLRTPEKLSKKELEGFVQESYQLIKSKLPRKIISQLGLDK